MKKIADAGLLNAALDRKDEFHDWACRVLQTESPPFLVCEVVLAEAAAVIGTPDDALKMLERGDLELAFDLAEEAAAVRALVKRYRDQPMDLGDACVVRMAELFPTATVFTVDRTDFTVYRKHGRQLVPCTFPG